MSVQTAKPSGHSYRVLKRICWTLGGRSALRFEESTGRMVRWWEGGKGVVYEPGDTAYFEDQDLRSVYLRLEALDDAGRAALDKVRAEAEAPPRRIAVESLDPDQRSSLAWALADTKTRQGEGLRETLIWAIRNGAKMPDDEEDMTWIEEALEGKHDQRRGRGRPKKRKRRTMMHAAVERGIRDDYHRWLDGFTRERELTWLRAEAQRLRREQPDAPAWRQMFDTYTEEGRQSFEAALKNLGARPCPPALQGDETARELALAATAEQYGPQWKSLEGKRLTPATVARIVTRARKSQ